MLTLLCKFRFSISGGRANDVLSVGYDSIFGGGQSVASRGRSIALSGSSLKVGDKLPATCDAQTTELGTIAGAESIAEHERGRTIGDASPVKTLITSVIKLSDNRSNFDLVLVGFCNLWIAF
jgi:hypothetical protein